MAAAVAAAVAVVLISNIDRGPVVPIRGPSR